MPDWTQEGIAGWFRALRPDQLARDWPPAVRAIETEPDVVDRLAILGALLDELAGAEVGGLRTALNDASVRDSLSAILAQLGAARVMRLLHWFAEIGLPDCHNITGSLMRGDSQSGRAIRATVDAVVRRAVLDRMFSLDRIAALQLARTVAEIGQ